MNQTNAKGRREVKRRKNKSRWERKQKKKKRSHKNEEIA